MGIASLRSIWDTVAYYTRFGYHKKLGSKLKDIKPEVRLKYLLGEVKELIAAPHDLKEMADVTACLFSHVQQEGYTLEQLGECVRAKLAWRIRLPKEAVQDFGKVTLNETQRRIKKACDELAGELCAKNEAYGDSALHPVGIFSKGSAVEGIKVRLDDELNRIKNKPDVFGEDPIKDTLGYLILLQLAMEDEKGARNA